jgi:hypothetical protein
MTRLAIYIDSCALDRLVEFGIDPIVALDGTEFALAVTPDLMTEYKAVMEANGASPAVRALASRMLGATEMRGIFGFDGPPFSGFDEGIRASPEQIDLITNAHLGAPRSTGIPKHRTDVHLSALAQTDLVITDNQRESHWRKSPSGHGRLVLWDDLEAALKTHGALAKALRGIL